MGRGFFTLKEGFFQEYSIVVNFMLWLKTETAKNCSAVSPSLSESISMYINIYLNLSLSLSLFITHSLSLSLSLYISLSLSLSSLSLTLPLFLGPEYQDISFLLLFLLSYRHFFFAVVIFSHSNLNFHSFYLRFYFCFCSWSQFYFCYCSYFCILRWCSYRT